MFAFVCVRSLLVSSWLVARLWLGREVALTLLIRTNVRGGGGFSKISNKCSYIEQSAYPKLENYFLNYLKKTHINRLGSYVFYVKYIFRIITFVKQAYYRYALGSVAK